MKMTRMKTIDDDDFECISRSSRSFHRNFRSPYCTGTTVYFYGNWKPKILFLIRVRLFFIVLFTTFSGTRHLRTFCISLIAIVIQFQKFPFNENRIHFRSLQHISSQRKLRPIPKTGKLFLFCLFAKIKNSIFRVNWDRCNLLRIENGNCKSCAQENSCACSANMRASHGV